MRYTIGGFGWEGIVIDSENQLLGPFYNGVCQAWEHFAGWKKDRMLIKTASHKHLNDLFVAIVEDAMPTLTEEHMLERRKDTLALLFKDSPKKERAIKQYMKNGYSELDVEGYGFQVAYDRFSEAERKLQNTVQTVLDVIT